MQGYPRHPTSDSDHIQKSTERHRLTIQRTAKRSNAARTQRRHRMAGILD
jgi:hypothetical protein